MLANQAVISLTGQELLTNEKEPPNVPILWVFVLQMQSAALQDQTLIGSDNYETTTSSPYQSETDVTL